ncbi:MAG: biosynthetic-type acetolactate synthase large subunit [Oscillospiraceae bacterium]|nr:biosynthetic-type acetolactate synthase large subunit [Oscillospiraceae bacterium]
MEFTGAEILVKELIGQGVDTVFGYPGGYVIDIYDELYKHADKITHILPAHEQGAAHAADAYARVSGKAGVVIATGGPGATNLITGIANAYLDSVPVVFITGNVAINMLGQDSFQDIDIAGVTLPIVKHSYVVRNVNQLQNIIREAFRLAATDRKGPVHIDIPKSIQHDKAEQDKGTGTLSCNRPRQCTCPPVFDEIEAVCDLIKSSERPYIYCGGGVTATDTGNLVIQLSRRIHAPVGLSMMGIGSIPSSFELNLGMSGMHGRYASIAAKSEADLIIALGVRFSDRAGGNAKEYADNTAVIHVDIDAAELGKNIKPDISINGDLKIILPELLERVDAVSNTKWLERVKELREKDTFSPGEEFTPQNIIACVNEHYDDDTVITTDVGQHQMWVAQYYKFEKPRKFISSGGLGAMGYGLGAAVGASIARGRKRVVLFTGDGSFGMNLPELATAVTQKLPITIILLNNNSLGMVRQLQTLFFDKRYSNTLLDRKTDFPAVARAFGAAGFSADSIAQLRLALNEIPKELPCLIECKIDIDEKVLPMIPVGGTIEDVILD